MRDSDTFYIINDLQFIIYYSIGMNLRSSATPVKKGQESPTSITNQENVTSHVEVISDNEDKITIKIDKEIAKLWKNKVSEFDPVVCFCWKQELDLGLQAANLAQPEIPGWIPTGYPITPLDFKSAILRHCQDGATTGGIVDKFIIAPNTIAESTNVTMKIANLSLDPFIKFIANAANSPLARIHLFMDKTTRLTSIPVNIVRPFALDYIDIQPFI